MIVKSFRALENSNDFAVFKSNNTVSRIPMTQCTSEIISTFMKLVEKKYSSTHDTPLTPPDITISSSPDPETGDSFMIYTLTYIDPDVEEPTLEDYKSQLS